MTTPQQHKDAIHESGHALLAKLFDEDFEIKSITLKPELYSEQVDTTKWRGGIHLKPRQKKLQDPSVQNKDKLIISMWGGLAAQNIFIKGKEDIKSNLMTYLNSPNLLEREGFSGDWDLTHKYITEQTQIRGISYDNYRVGFLGFAFEYLMLDKVWETTISLADLILSKPDLTLTQTEIEQHYVDTNFLKFLYKNKSKILSKRYSVPVGKKLIYYFKYLIS